MVVRDLSVQLLRERDMLELLIFKLDVQRLLIDGGRDRWILRSDSEVDRVIAAMPAVAMSRAICTASVAEAWGEPDAANLAELIDAAPIDVWREIFTDHRQAIRALLAELEQLKRLLMGALRDALQETAMSIAELEQSQDSVDSVGDVNELARLYRYKESIEAALKTTSAVPENNIAEYVACSG